MSDDVSLFALMDSHLSSTRLDELQLGNDGSDPACSTSSLHLPTPPGPRLVIPNFFPRNSPMKEFLAEQIANTLKAKEKQNQKEQEQQKIEEDMKKLKIKKKEKEQLSTVDGIAKMKLHDEQEYLIDLTPAIIRHAQQNLPEVQPHVSDDISSKISRPKPGQTQSLPELPLRWDKETCLYKSWNPNLPCTTDVSYILKQKLKRGKCSTFGKVLCSRVRPTRHIYIPNEIENFDSNIVRFDFKSKSPCDIYKDNQRKPKMSTRWTVDIMDYI